MLTILKLVNFLTVAYFAKCDSNNTLGKDITLKYTEGLPDDTHKLNSRFTGWQNEMSANTVNISSSPTNASADSNSYSVNDTLWTWVPIETTSTTVSTTTTTTSTTTTTTTASPGIVKAKDMCKFYKPPENPIHVQDMSDIWQIMYYQLPETLQCFRIHIRNVLEEERISHRIRYGTFDAKVNWTNVLLEVRALTNINRKHFLEGTDQGDGVLKNIVILEDKQHLRYVYQEESSDQWLVHRNLLLMRDCDKGGIVVFSRVPHLPLQRDIVDALKGFSEEFKDGKSVCDEENHLMRYYEEDDQDLEKY